MNEGDIVGDHVNQLELIAKELVDTGHTFSDKMQVTIVLNSLPPSWDHIVTSLTHSGKELAMTTLPVLLMLEEDRMKRRKRDNASRHYKINYPLNKRPKHKGKEISMTITEALVIESPPTSWWVDSAATRHIARNRELFVDLKEKNLISVPVLDEKGFEVKMKSGRVFISKGDISVSSVKVDALSTAAYILNRVKAKSKPLTPFEIWTGHQPDMTNLKVWGCKAHVFISKCGSASLSDMWKMGAHIGFSTQIKGLIESRDAVFIEDTKLITPLEQIKKLLHAESKELDPHVSVFSDKDLENSGRKRTSLEPVMPSIDADDSGRKRQRRPSSMLKDYYLMESKVVAIEDDLANFVKAMESRKPVGCKWVLRKKYKIDEFLDKYKASNSPDMMKETKFCLGSKFEMKDMGPANYVLGIRISRDRDSKLIYLDQENYLEKVLKRFKMEDCRPVSTPVSKGTILNKSMCPTNKTELEEMIAVPYAQAVSSLMYTMTSTRPDICYAVGLVSRYQSNPGKAHWQAVKRIFWYLQMTKSMKLCFGLDELEIKGFIDANFAGDTDDRKSTSRYVFLFGGTAVSWLSKIQGCVAKYTMEAEYIICSTAVSNVV
uniref:Reverse transcriptase Ty1/copia-type domain-containing protein n=1 Tax=Fagus sylvatica TaxID=28930 RepID=A0A2N9GQ88_FAGSY